MIHLALRAARADLRAAPSRTVAVALLLFVAAVLPEILRPGEVPGLVLAAIVASSATAGAAAQHELRSRILVESGAGPGAQVLVAVAGVAGPGVVAAVGAAVLALGSQGPSGMVGAVGIALLAPLAVAAGVAWAAAPGAALGRRGSAAVAVLVAVTAPMLVVPLVLLAVLVGSRLGRSRLRVRVAATAVAVAATVGAAFVVSTAETFFDMAFLLVVISVPLTLAVGWLGSAAVTIVAAVVARVGPTGRLAATPLARRRRQLGPVAAVVAVVATLAAADGVVGASFEEREARRQPPEVLGRAGTQSAQAIVVTTGLDPVAERRLVAEAVGTTPVRVAVIDRVGGGSTETSPGSERDPVGFLDFSGAPPDVGVAAAAGPTWVGVVAPDALGPLGLAGHKAALARGDALVLNPDVLAVSGQVEVTGGRHGPLRLPGVVVTDRAGLLLPAVLVSEARADELGGVRNGARAVVVPGPRTAPGDALAVAQRMRSAVGETVARAGQGDAFVEGLDSPSTFGSLIERGHAVSAGDRQLRMTEVPPLDRVPLLARSGTEGQRRAVVLGSLAVLVALAGTLLVVGGARAEDAVLLVQGAPERHRATTTMVQTATVGLAGSALGALVGLGVPALAFHLYNGRPRDPRTLDIPLVVPPTVVLLLVALPVVAALVAAALAATRRDPSPQLLAEAARS